MGASRPPGRMTSAKPLVVFALLGFVAFAGCLSDNKSTDDAPAANIPTTGPLDLRGLLPTTTDAVMTFTQSIVSPAQGIGQDLYEPTMEVSDTGVLYVAAHVIGAATTGTPAWYSRDDGATWTQLPFIASVSAPPPIQGAQPPPGDEGFIVYGDNGQAWMADIYAAGFSVTGWCNDGAELCYDNRQAYDRIKATTEFCADGADPMASTAASLNDRPWAAYAPGVGQLLLVNNPGGGPMQIGRLAVPPTTPVGLMDPVTGPEWNLCASPDGWIPGIPAMRRDGFFAVPQMTGSGDQERLTMVTGNIANIFDVLTTDVFHVSSSAGGTSNGGRTAFGLDGTLFAGAYNNTRADANGNRTGQFIIAASTDNGTTYSNITVVVGSPVRSLYLDGNMGGPGALLTWSQLNEDTSKSDWYVAHVFVGADGKPELRNVALAVQAGPHSSAHVMGAAAGPDGRAYFVNFQGAALADYVLSTPISIWIQQDGPTLPIVAAAAAV